MLGSLAASSEAVIIDLSLLDQGCPYVKPTASSPKTAERCPAMPNQQESITTQQSTATRQEIHSEPPAVTQSQPAPVATPAPAIQARLAAFVQPATATDSAQDPLHSASRAAAVTASPVGSSDSALNQLQQIYTKEHFAYIRKIINEKISYPRAARIRGQEGTVMVTFIIRKDGTISHPQIVSSSGYALLDEQAISAILDAAPFPRPPLAAQMRVPVVYQLALTR